MTWRILRVVVEMRAEHEVTAKELKLRVEESLGRHRYFYDEVTKPKPTGYRRGYAVVKQLRPALIENIASDYLRSRAPGQRRPKRGRSAVRDNRGEKR